MFSCKLTVYKLLSFTCHLKTMTNLQIFLLYHYLFHTVFHYPTVSIKLWFQRRQEIEGTSSSFAEPEQISQWGSQEIGSTTTKGARTIQSTGRVSICIKLSEGTSHWWHSSLLVLPRLLRGSCIWFWLVCHARGYVFPSHQIKEAPPVEYLS